MKIGVDASCWINRRGYGRYTRELIGALLQLDSKNDYRLFLDAATAEQSESLPDTSRVERVVVATSSASGEAASASGYRPFSDLIAMGRSIHQHGGDLDILYFPSVYTFFPVIARTKLLVTIHDTTAEKYPHLIFPGRRAKLFWNLKVRYAVWRADAVATVSETSKREIAREFRLKERSIKVIPDAVASALHRVDDRDEVNSVLAKYGISDSDRIILYVGGISPHKNLPVLIDALGSLLQQNRFPGLKLVLVGDYLKDGFYSAYPSLREKVGLLGLNAAVVFTGFVPDRDLQRIYSAAELLVIPSLDEGFGLPAIEAMACGLPVLASHAGALPEVVGSAGLLFDPRSSEELATKIGQLLADEVLRQRLAREAVRRAQEFTWEKSARRALAVFEEMVRNHGAD